ncbi:hypothetical protein [Phaeodactylibacter xiamenensis]|uniref:hypothetical protein n=1 Tax=Phaeodactylibacter xiamenensis TaxID=1524460 RepID=UPI0024A9F75C|nr:hypothetical protein [Phaeodactylibacter xiamenensis]
MKTLTSATTGNPGDVVDVVHISDSVGSAAVTADTYAFSEQAPPAKVLHVPTLEELGFDAANYEMKALLIVNARTNNPDKDVRVRLVQSSGKEVASSEVAATLTSSSQDVIVKSASAFAITPGEAYAHDIRLVTAGNGDNATMQSKSLLIQVVKKSAA